MNFKKVIIGTMVASQLVTAQMAAGFTVSVYSKPFGGLFGSVKMGRLSGHEEITRQALLITLQTLRAEGMKLDEKDFKVILGDLESTEDGTVGAVSGNAIIQGNYATDMPANETYPTLLESLRIENSAVSYFAPLKVGTASDRSKLAGLARRFVELVKRHKLASLTGIQAFFLNISLEKYLEQKVETAPDIGARLDALVGFLTELDRQAKTWGGDWHNNPDGQVAHFLRNYTNTADANGLATAKETCKDATDIMTRVTSAAVRLWPVIARTEKALKGIPEAKRNAKAKEVAAKSMEMRRLMFFLIGHVTHMIQDSFSGEHTIRAIPAGFAFAGVTEAEENATLEQRRNTDLLDICYYGEGQFNALGKEARSACYHKYLSPSVATAKILLSSQTRGDFGDSIWTRGTAEVEKIDDEIRKIKNNFTITKFWEKLGEPVEQSKASDGDFSGPEKWTNLNSNARLARAATVKYLYVVSKYLLRIQRALDAGKKGSMDQLDPKSEMLKASLKAEFFEGQTVSAADSKKALLPLVEISDSDDKTGKFTTRIRPIANIMPFGVIRCSQLKN